MLKSEDLLIAHLTDAFFEKEFSEFQNNKDKAVEAFFCFVNAQINTQNIVATQGFHIEPLMRLYPYQIARFVIAFYDVQRMAPFGKDSHPDDDILAIREPNTTTYSTSKSALAKAMKQFCRSLTQSEYNEVCFELLILKEAERRSAPKELILPPSKTASLPNDWITALQTISKQPIEQTSSAQVSPPSVKDPVFGTANEEENIAAIYDVPDTNPYNFLPDIDGDGFFDETKQEDNPYLPQPNEYDDYFH